MHDLAEPGDEGVEGATVTLAHKAAHALDTQVALALKRLRLCLELEKAARREAGTVALKAVSTTDQRSRVRRFEGSHAEWQLL